MLLFLMIIDFYVFRTFQNQFASFSNITKYSIYGLYWLVPIILISFILYGFVFNGSDDSKVGKAFWYIMVCLGVFYIPKLFITIFQGIEDISKLAAWVTKKLSNPESTVYSGADKISRSVFIGRLGLIIASIPFASVIYGIVKGRFNFNVKKQTIWLNNLPESFDGFKIVQFSDFHAGSLIGQQEEFIKAIHLMNAQEPDAIVFTGDIVNNKSSELKDWIEVLAKLKAKHGKYAVLGNHDYGDYVQWNTPDEKVQNMKNLKGYYKQMGFNLLLNQTHIFEKNNEKLALLGVENWGEKPFPQLGRLDLALEQAEGVECKVLLSHDPTHWEHQVINKTDIALTLSGHTHGMQMAINVGNFSWSPVSMRYPRWKGLYTENNQHLYVNIGLGYIGFPGRVGTDPEITVFELKREVNA